MNFNFSNYIYDRVRYISHFCLTSNLDNSQGYIHVEWVVQCTIRFDVSFLRAMTEYDVSCNMVYWACFISNIFMKLFFYCVMIFKYNKHC